MSAMKPPSILPLIIAIAVFWAWGTRPAADDLAAKRDQAYIETAARQAAHESDWARIDREVSQK